MTIELLKELSVSRQEEIDIIWYELPFSRFRRENSLANPHLNDGAVLIPKLRTLFCRVP